MPEAIRCSSGIVRNRLKILGAVRNAQAFLYVQEEFGTFDRYIYRELSGGRLSRCRRA